MNSVSFELHGVSSISSTTSSIELIQRSSIGRQFSTLAFLAMYEFAFYKQRLMGISLLLGAMESPVVSRAKNFVRESAAALNQKTLRPPTRHKQVLWADRTVKATLSFKNVHSQTLQRFRQAKGMGQETVRTAPDACIPTFLFLATSPRTQCLRIQTQTRP